MLSDRCLSVLSVCLSVTLVYCGQTAEWIKMKLGMQVGLGPGHIVLDGNSASSQRGTAPPQFSAHICCGQMAGLIGMELNLGPGDFMFDGDPAPPRKKGTAPHNFWPMSTVAKRLDG